MLHPQHATPTKNEDFNKFEKEKSYKQIRHTGDINPTQNARVLGHDLQIVTFAPATNIVSLRLTTPTFALRPQATISVHQID